MLHVREDKDGLLFWVVVRPRSRKNEIVDVREGSLRIRVTATPVEGAANEACRKILSEALGVSKASITIRTGHTAKKKLVHCLNLTLKRLVDTIENMPAG